MTRVYRLRGTGEVLGGRSMLGSIPGEDVPYLAEIRPIGLRSYAESVRDARTQLAAVEANAEPYVLVGFSLGAAAAGDFVQYDRPRHCRGVVLLADPKRHARQCTNRGVDVRRWGIAGQRRIDAVPCRTFTIPDDPISALPGDNGLRQLANHITGLQQPIGQVWNLGYTWQWAWKYLVDGRHVAYLSERTDGGRTYIDAVRAAVEELL